MQVSQLWKDPVKSMIGTPVDVVEVTATGIVGDRTWAARDLERGGIRGAKKIGRLMQLAARDVTGGHVEIDLPDGSTVSTAEDDVDERVSAALGHQVRLERLRPADDLDHYRRGGPDSDDMLAELNGIFGRVEGEPLPDFGVFPPEVIEYESPPGTYHDAFPLLVMTTAALQALADALPQSNVDVRRFRPSVVLDGRDVHGHPEFTWAGRRATIGGAEIEFTAPCPRCVMVTREIDGATPEHRALLRHIVRDLDQNVGVYANVVAPGSVELGDELRFVD